MENTTTKNVLYLAGAALIIYLIFFRKKNKADTTINNSNPNATGNTGTVEITPENNSTTINNFFSQGLSFTSSVSFGNLEFITTQNGVDNILFSAPAFGNGDIKNINLPDGNYDKIYIHYNTGSPSKMTIVSNGITYNGVNTGGRFTCYNVVVKGGIVVNIT